jgi:hypothetical protein
MDGLFFLQMALQKNNFPTLLKSDSLILLLISRFEE